MVCITPEDHGIPWVHASNYKTAIYSIIIIVSSDTVDSATTTSELPCKL